MTTRQNSFAGLLLGKLLEVLSSHKTSLMAALVAVLPWLGQEVFQLPVLAFQSFTDAVFYPAYSVNFEELVLRYGWVYYATRFGVIFPDAVAAYLFGAPEGWVIVRKALQSGLLVLVFLFFTRWGGGGAAGLFAALLWWTSPVALRLLGTTYVDALGVPFVVAGALLLGWPGAHAGRAAAAGVLWGMAASAHLYLALMMVLILPWCAGAQWPRVGAFLRNGVWALLAGAGVWLAAWMYYRMCWGLEDFLAPTRDLMARLATGDTDPAKRPLLDALNATPVWLAMPLLPLAMMLFLRRGSALLWGAWLSAGLSAGLYWTGEIFAKAYAMSLPFYFSFAWPAVFLGGSTLFSEWLRRMAGGEQGKHPWAAWAAVATAGIYLIITGQAQARLSGAWLVWLVVGAATLALLGAGVVAALKFRWSLGKTLAVLVCLCSVQTLTLGTGFFAHLLGDYKRQFRNDAWQPKLAATLNALLPPAAEDGRVAVFWYDDAEPSFLRMVQAGQLHGFGAFHVGAESGLSFPALREKDYEELLSRGIQIMVPLALTEGQLLAAVDSLQGWSPEWRVTRQGKASDRGRTLYYAVMERDMRLDAAQTGTERAARWKPYYTPRVFDLPGGRVLLETDTKHQHFDARADIPSHGEKGVVEVELQVVRGRLLLSLLDEGGHTLASAAVWPTREMTRRVLPVPAYEGQLTLVARNLMPTGSRSLVVLGSTRFVPETSR